MSKTSIGNWAEQPDISARSVIVTIIGDTLVPVGASMWMSQMLELASVFGFSDRLVRTSMTRLVNEGWLVNERVGRESNYHLTDLALRESTQAADRIYGVGSPDWTGEWTLLFFPSPGNVDKSIADGLRWQGFVPLGRDVFASPSTKPDAARELLAPLSLEVRPAIATATFDELERLVEAGFFLNEADTAEQTTEYTAFVSRYRQLAGPAKRSQGSEAFGYRTMLVHDLRRIRLRWPDPPPATRPPTWAGDDATKLATELYPLLTQHASDWLSDVFGDNYPTHHPGRFGLT